jgi:hypothetical protein
MSEVWVVEVNETGSEWGPVEAHVEKDDAEIECKGWRKDAPHDKWRVTRYVPDTGEKP